MKKNFSTIFIIVVMIVLSVYVFTMHKVTIFNHSGQEIKSVKMDAGFTHKELLNLENNQSNSFIFFSPLRKNVHLKITLSNQISSIIFPLEGFTPLDKKNQIEIRIDGSIKHGALGLK